MKPTELSKEQTKKVLESFKPNTQISRLVEYLARNPRTTRSELCSNLSLSNPSDLALRYNPILRKHQLAIGCCPSPIRYTNKYAQPTAMAEWSLNKLSPSELKLPIKGPNRPVVRDPLFNKRREYIEAHSKEGQCLNKLLAKSKGVKA